MPKTEVEIKTEGKSFKAIVISIALAPISGLIGYMLSHYLEEPHFHIGSTG